MSIERSALEFRAGPDGILGVFAAEPLAAGAVVESCYCVPLKPSDIPGDSLLPWLYDRNQGGDEPLLFPFGWGLLYNETSHQGSESNVVWKHEVKQDANNEERDYITFRAKVEIDIGDELCCSHQLSGRGRLRDILGFFFEAVSFDPNIPLPRSGSNSHDPAASNVDVSNGTLSSSEFQGVAIQCSPIHGHGVYARKNFAKDEVIELAPNLLINRWELGICLVDYRFNLWSGFEEQERLQAGCASLQHGVKVSLGLGSIFNHNDVPNVGHRPAVALNCTAAQSFMTCYYALRDIPEGEEMFISYGPKWWASRAEKNTSLAEWRLKRGETKTGRPFYDDPAIAQTGMMPEMIEKLHRAFVDAEDVNSSELKAWGAVCAKLENKANIHGGMNTPLRETGERAMHRAAAMGHVQKLKWLVMNGADVAAATAPALDLSAAGDMSSSLYPAHVAAMHGHINALRVLHSSGADINCRRPDGATPLDFAEDVGQDEVAAWLLARGGIHGIPS